MTDFLFTHVPLILLIIITILGSIAIFAYLGITFDSHSVSVLKRAAIIETN
jgi:hypothetical protein